MLAVTSRGQIWTIGSGGGGSAGALPNDVTSLRAIARAWLPALAATFGFSGQTLAGVLTTISTVLETLGLPPLPLDAPEKPADEEMGQLRIDKIFAERTPLPEGGRSSLPGGESQQARSSWVLTEPMLGEATKTDDIAPPITEDSLDVRDWESSTAEAGTLIDAAFVIAGVALLAKRESNWAVKETDEHLS